MGSATEAKELPLKTIAEGGFSGHDDRKNYVIKDRVEWGRLWDIVNSCFIPKSSLFDIDFNKYMVIAAFQGQQNTGGYGIEIFKAIETEKNIEVYIKESYPEHGYSVAEVITNPYHIIKTKKTDKEVIFR